MTHEELRATSLVITDESGNPRIRLGVDNTSGGDAIVTLYSRDEEKALVLRAFHDGGASITIPRGDESSLFSVEAPSDGLQTSRLVLFGGNGVPAVSLFAEGSGNGWLQCTRLIPAPEGVGGAPAVQECFPARRE